MNRFGRLNATLFGLVFAARAFAASPPTGYTLTDLGTLSGNSATYYSATGLNSSGQVCGWASGNRPFLWTPTTPNGTSGSIIDLGDLPTATSGIAYGINNYGQVVGHSDTHNAPGRIFSAFLWTPTSPNGTTGSMTDISKPTGSGDEGDSINASGQVAGETAGGSAESLWTPTTPNGTTGSIAFPGTLPGTDESFPGKLNTRGQIPGSSYGAFTDQLYHANLWSPTTPNGTSGSMIDLGDPPGGTNQSYAHSVNAAGKVVGAGTTAIAQHASLWTPTTPNGTTGSLTDLQSLISSSNDSEAYDINNSDLIVGRSEISSNNYHATLWTSGGPVDLNSLIDQPIGGPVGSFVLTSATGINDLGQIVCDGSVGGAQHAILLTPVGLPEPGAIGLLVFALRAPPPTVYSRGMNYRELGKTGVKVSEISFGCWTMGGLNWVDGTPNGWANVDEAEITAGIKAAIDAGVNHFDNADVYGNGRAERMLARVFDRLGVKSTDFIIATKIGWFPGTAENAYEPAHIRHQCEQSLINLKREYIDLYYFHHGSFGEGYRYLPAAAETMERMVKEGKVRIKGQSAYSADDFEKIVPVVKPSVLQSWAHALDDQFVSPGSRVSNLMAKHGITFVAFSPLAQARLLDKYDPSKPPQFEPGDHRKDSKAFSAEEIAKLKPKLAKLKQRFGATTEDLVAMALNYVLAQPHVACVIPGFRNERQAKMNLSAAGRKLGDADLTFVRETLGG